MSSNCPPQLHLTLPANATSFKRSFEQFGFDLEESPVQGSGIDTASSSGGDGNDRNKRARSASSFSDDDVSIGSSQSLSGTSSSSSSSSASLSSSISGNEVEGVMSSAGLSTTRPPDVTFGAPHHLSLSLTRASLEPPRLPTPEIQDIDMIDYPLIEDEDSDEDRDEDEDDDSDDDFHDAPSSPVHANQPPTSSNGDYRLSLERFSVFDRHISALRRSHSPPPVVAPRASTVPPVLPPLALLEDDGTASELNADTGTSSFLQGHTPPATPWSSALNETFYTANTFNPDISGPRHGGTSQDSDHNRDRSRNRISEPNIFPEVQPQYAGIRSNDFTTASPPGTQRPLDRTQATATGPWVEFSPDVLWAHYDDTPSPSTDNSEHEHESFNQPSFGRSNFDNVMPSLDELRSASPLFHVDDLDGNVDLSPGANAETRPNDDPNPNTSANTHPPTLPPLSVHISHSNDSIESDNNDSWDDPLLRLSAARLRGLDTRRVGRELGLSDLSSSSRSRSRSGGDAPWRLLRGPRTRRLTLPFLEAFSDGLYPPSNVASPNNGSSSSNSSTSTDTPISSSSGNSSTSDANQTGTMVANTITANMTPGPVPEHGTGAVNYLGNGERDEGDYSRPTGSSAEWVSGPHSAVTDREWFTDYLGRVTRDVSIDLDMDMERAIERAAIRWTDSDVGRETEWDISERRERARERERARARERELQMGMERQRMRDRERERDRHRQQMYADRERERIAMVGGWSDRERRETLREREREHDLIATYATGRNALRQTTESILSALDEDSPGSLSSTSFDFNLLLGRNNNSNGNNRGSNTLPQGPRPFPRRPGSRDMLDAWAASAFEVRGIDRRNRSNSESSSSSESSGSSTGLPLPPRLQPLDEELLFSRFGASPGAGGSGSVNGGTNESPLMRRSSNRVSGASEGRSGGLQIGDRSNSTAPRLQRPSLSPLGLEALYGLERRARIPLDERSQERERLDRDIDNDRSPARIENSHPFRYSTDLGEAFPWREHDSDIRDPNHDQQHLSSLAEPNEDVSTIHFPSRPRSRHGASNSLHNSDPRRRETRALGPRPISRDIGVNAGWNVVSSPRNDLADRTSTRADPRERPRPNFSIYRPIPHSNANANTEGSRVTPVGRPNLSIDTAAEPISVPRSTGRSQPLLLPRWSGTNANTNTNTNSSLVPEPSWQSGSFIPSRHGGMNTNAGVMANTSSLRPQSGPIGIIDRHSLMPAARRQPLRHEQGPSSSASTLADHAMNMDDFFAVQTDGGNSISDWNSGPGNRADPWVAVPPSPTAISPNNNASSSNNRSPLETPSDVYTRLMEHMRHELHTSEVSVAHTPMEVPSRSSSDVYTRLMERMRNELQDSEVSVAPTHMEQAPSPSTPDFPVITEDLFELPRVPSPGLGGIFDRRDHQHAGFLDEIEQSRRRSDTPTPQSIREPYLPPLRRRSPSPTREEQASRIPWFLRSRSPHSSGGNTSSRLIAESFRPGPFRNTVERMFEVNRRHETSEDRPTHRSNAPSIPPLPFQGETSPGARSQQEDSLANSQQAPRAQGIWREPTPAIDSNRLSSAELVDRHNNGEWWDGSSPRQPRRSAPRPPSVSFVPSRRPSQPRHVADVHTILSRQQRMEAARIADSEDATPSSQNSPVRDGEIDGFSHAIDVLRHDGLSSPRSRQLIDRYHQERDQANAESGNPLSSASSSSSPWGVFDSWSRPEESVLTPQRRIRGGRLPPPVVESELSRHRDSWDTERESITSQIRQRHGRITGHHGGIGHAPIFPSGGPLREYLGRIGRRGRALGDYVRDEDFDESYESLISLAQTLGEAKPRATPENVLATLETGKYKDWKTPDSDHRCPICLDDYQPDDPVLKLADCSHWLHRECLQQWLKGASTCPVCRKAVGGASRKSTHHHHHIHHHHSNYPGSHWRRDDAGSGSGSSGTGTSRAGGSVGQSPYLAAWRYGT